MPATWTQVWQSALGFLALCVAGWLASKHSATLFLFCFAILMLLVMAYNNDFDTRRAAKEVALIFLSLLLAIVLVALYLSNQPEPLPGPYDW